MVGTGAKTGATGATGATAADGHWHAFCFMMGLPEAEGRTMLVRLALPKSICVALVLTWNHGAHAETTRTSAPAAGTEISETPTANSTSAVAQPEPLRQFALLGTVAASSAVFGPGLDISADIGRYLRLGVSGGLFAAGNGHQEWAMAEVGVRLLSGDRTKSSGAVPSLLLESGLGQFNNYDSADGHNAYRKTTVIPVLATFDLTWARMGKSGLTLRLSAGMVGVVSQDIGDRPHRTWEPYDMAWLSKLAVGYAL